MAWMLAETGVYKKANGDVYDGEWRDGKKNGQGACGDARLLSEQVRQYRGTEQYPRLKGGHWVSAGQASSSMPMVTSMMANGRTTR